MKPIILTGILLVNLALIAYSVAIFTEQKRKIVNNFILFFITIGVLLDMSATACMIIGSSHTALTSHGIFGYSALTGMLIDCISFWKHKKKFGTNTKVNRKLHLYSRLAYIWWLLAYITGIIIINIRHF